VKRTLVVGWDAACWEYVKPLLDAGRLPVLDALMKGGVGGTLRSTMPAMTPTAWSSMVTGKNPGKHGVFDMQVRRPGSYDFVVPNATMRLGTPFWRRLNEAGFRVGLVNVPFTYPAQPLEGFMLCGFGTPEEAEAIAYPSQALEKVERVLGRYRPVVDERLATKGSMEALLQSEADHQRMQVAAANLLAKTYDVEILVINLMYGDHANHYAPTMAEVEAALCQMDGDTGRLVEAFAPENVFVVADHGSRRVKGNFLLAAWLRDQGYYLQTPNRIDAQRPMLNWVLSQWLQQAKGLSGGPERLLRGFARELLPRAPLRIQRQVWNRIEAAMPQAWDRVRFGLQTDVKGSRLLPGTSYSGAYYLNLKGRDPDGVVLLEEKDELLAELTGRLTKIVDPENGRPLFSDIHQGTDIYSGPAAAYGPDLVLDSYDAAFGVLTTDYRDYGIPERTAHRYFINNGGRRDSGRHSRDGLFVFSGTDFRGDGQNGLCGSVLDLPATLLFLYDVPVPDDYDGRILFETLNEQMNQRPLAVQPGDGVIAPLDFSPYLAEEEAALMSQLRALGYVD
jgi:predicted AlkP superfamily phosphohydrolase/phosphomutase